MLFAPARCLVRSNLACLTTLGKQSYGIEGSRVKNCDYNRALNDVKRSLRSRRISAFAALKGHLNAEATEIRRERRVYAEVFRLNVRFCRRYETKKL